MIIQDLVEKTVRRTNRNDTNISNVAVDCLLETYKSFGSEYPFVELQNTFSITSVKLYEKISRELPLPIGIRAVLMLSITDTSVSLSSTLPLKRRLKKASYRDVEKSSLQPSPPMRYARWGEKLWIDPIPNRNDYVFNLFAWTYPNTTPGANTSIYLPDEWIECLVWGGVWRVLVEHRDYDSAQEVKNNVLLPLLVTKINNLKTYIERQDWDTAIPMLQSNYSPVF